MRSTIIRSLTAAACGLIVVLMVSSIFAQAPPEGGMGGRGPMRGPRGGGPGMMRGGMGVAGLLVNPQVQQELNLTDEQKDQLQKVGETVMEDVRKAMEKKVAEILTPEQLKRVKQIELQQRGVMVLADPEVAAELGLTEDQKSQLNQIQEDARKQMREAWQSGQGGGGNMWQKIQEMRRENEKKAMEVLTPEQKTKLAEMMGEPFELDRPAMRGGDRQGGRRGEGRPGGGRRPRGNRQETI